MLWNTFKRDMAMLKHQYDEPTFDPATGLDYPELRERTLALAHSLKGRPQPVVKARAFAFILDHAQIMVNPADWFGIHFNTTRVFGKKDAGWSSERILTTLSYEKIDEAKQGRCSSYASERSRQLIESGTLVMYPDYDHTSPDWLVMQANGFVGLRRRISAARAAIVQPTPGQTAFFDGEEIAWDAILRFVNRVAGVVEAHAGKSEKMTRLHAALRKLELGAPSNLYEALLFALIYWKLQEHVDCYRVRTLGDIGNYCRRFYEQDVVSGALTRLQAKELIQYFLCQFTAMNVMYQQPMFFGRNLAGEIEVNEFSRLVFDAYDEANFYDPKLQICVAPETPDDFIKRVLQAIRGGNSSISLINDTNAVKALLRAGVSEEDARKYIMSGCWDFTAQNESKTIPLRLNFPKIIELALHDGVDPVSGWRLGPATGGCADFRTFEDFYRAFERQFVDVAEYAMSVVDEFEPYLHEFNPSLMYSAGIDSALKLGIDAYTFGAKYRSTCINFGQLGTVIDSLAAIRKFVYEKKEITLPEFAALLDRDWENDGNLRRKILRDPDKYGNGSPHADELMLRVAELCNRTCHNRPNARGGVYKIGQISIDFNVKFGAKTGATPDGRKRGEAHSKNIGPSVGMDRNGVTGLINSLAKMDMSFFSHAGMLDLVLHPSAVSGDEGLEVMLSILRTYFAKGGHSMQFNVFDADLLRDAQANPDRYRTLQVRVCGWNVYFVNLSRQEQEIFIRQAEHSAAGA